MVAMELPIGRPAAASSMVAAPDVRLARVGAIGLRLAHREVRRVTWPPRESWRKGRCRFAGADHYTIATCRILAVMGMLPANNSRRLSSSGRNALCVQLF